MTDEPISDDDLTDLEWLASDFLGDDPEYVRVSPSMLRSLILRLRLAEEKAEK
jgi:hypothetical protein